MATLSDLSARTLPLSGSTLLLAGAAAGTSRLEESRAWPGPSEDLLSSANHPVGSKQPRLGNREPERPRRVEIDYELEHGGLLDGKIGGLGPLDDTVNQARRLPAELRLVRPIAREATPVDEVGVMKHGWDRPP